jgi:malic enzyme
VNLKDLKKKKKTSFDTVILGGGSAGIACAKVFKNIFLNSRNV